MKKRIISGAITVRVNVGGYQHIEIVKQAQQEIEFSSSEERIQKEDELTADLVASIKRDIDSIPKSFNKGIEEAIKVQEAIKKTLPEWMGKENTPNILTDISEKLEVRVAAEQKEALDSATKIFENVESSAKEISKKTAAPATVSKKEEDELFEDDFGLTQDAPNPVVSEVIVEKKAEKKVEAEKPAPAPSKTAKTKTDDLFNDDLFD